MSYIKNKVDDDLHLYILNHKEQKQCSESVCEQIDKELFNKVRECLDHNFRIHIRSQFNDPL